MKQPFEIEWFGGASERHYREVRTGVDELPWKSLEPERYPALLLDRARISWTETALSAYTTAASLGAVLQALLEARAPLDLVGMAGDFVADEVLHVELASRFAMALGGGAPIETDFAALTPKRPDGLTAFQWANELVVRTCCVGQSFAVAMLAGTLRTTSHPLTRAVLGRIAKDVARHGRFGWLYLRWAAETMEPEERARLAVVAEDALRGLGPLLRRSASPVRRGVTTEGFRIEHIHDLGWMETSAYVRRARDVVVRDIATPLAFAGIVVPRETLLEIVAGEIGGVPPSDRLRELAAQ